MVETSVNWKTNVNISDLKKNLYFNSHWSLDIINSETVVTNLFKRFFLKNTGLWALLP